MQEPVEDAVRRTIDVLFSLSVIIILAPVFALLAVLILIDDGWPVVFSQERVGAGGKTFRILKFRSMRRESSGRLITAAGDPRVTRVGAVLRKLKLDEIAQFFNVLRGDMSLCGPRPEVPGYVDLNDPVWQAVLRVKPGITDPASLCYLNEEELLAQSDDPERTYRQTILPEKLAISLRYQSTRSLRTDFKLILLTARHSITHERSHGQSLEKTLLEEVLHGRRMQGPISSPVDWGRRDS